MTANASGPVAFEAPGRIPLRDRKGDVRAWALVDAEDYERVAAYRWCLNDQGYARRMDGEVAMRMHRFVMGVGPTDKIEVDHISRDTLDNRKGNLRLATHAQNRQNTSGHRNSTSQHRGVSWSTARRKWVAQAMLDGKNHLIGRFATEQEAADAASSWRAANMPFATN